MKRPDYDTTITLVNLVLENYPATEISSIQLDDNDQAVIVAFKGDEVMRIRATIDYEDFDAEWELTLEHKN
jgi:hypothetical protein